jgi:hypothetical protein
MELFLIGVICGIWISIGIIEWKTKQLKKKYNEELLQLQHLTKEK